MLIWSERFWDVDSRQIYSSLNTGKSSPNLWPATSDSCCPCWQYTLSSQILLMWSSRESLQNLAIRYKRMEALLMLIWSERFWIVDSRLIYSSLNTGNAVLFLDGQPVILIVLVGNGPCLANYFKCDHLQNLFKACQKRQKHGSSTHADLIRKVLRYGL